MFKKFCYIENIKDRYEIGKFLGEGAFGKVFECKHKASEKMFAIKNMNKD